MTVQGGIATFTNLSDNAPETIRLKFDGGGLESSQSTNVVITPVPSKLVIHTPPSTTAIAGQPLANQPVIYEEDQFGNLITDDNSTVMTASLASGTGTLAGTTSVTVVGGVATFTNLGYSVAETISLDFAEAGLKTDPTPSIVVKPATPFSLTIHTQPAGTATAGQSFTTQPVVYEEDRFGNLEVNDNNTLITATLANGTGPIKGSTAVAVSGGIATFSDLSDNTATSITLRFAGGGLTSPASVPIAISPAAASKLVISTAPASTAVAGQPFATQPVLIEEDPFGNHETGDNTTKVTAAVAGGAGPLQGTMTVTLTGGVATFTNLADNAAGPISLTFSGGTLTTTPSAITVSPGPAAKLVTGTQPSATALAGQAFGSQPVVYEEDQYGNVESGDNTTVVTASLASGVGPLQGTQAVTLSAGVARFTNLGDSTAGPITLRFTGGSLTSAATSAIQVAPLPPPPAPTPVVLVQVS